MIKDITIGQYIDGNSFLHRMDPRAKISCIFLYCTGLFLVNNLYGFAFTFAVALFIMLQSKISLKCYIRGLKPLLFIILFTAIMQIFMTPGTFIWQWAWFHISIEGLRLAFFMCTRLVLLVLMTSVLTLTTTPIALTDAIESILSPFRHLGLPAHELAMTMTIALRFIPTLIEETEKIIKAQAARGADFETGHIVRRAQALLPILVPLFISSIKRADELAIAMEARCYHGSEGRSRMRVLEYKASDFLMVVLAFIALTITIGSRYVALIGLS